VRHYACDFALALSGFDHAAIEEHRSARQGERVDLLLVHDFEGEAELRVAVLRGNGCGELLADFSHPAVDALVTEQRHLLPDLRRRFLPKLHVVGDRVAVFRGDDMRLRPRGSSKGNRRHEGHRDVCVSMSGQLEFHVCSQCKGLSNMVETSQVTVNPRVRVICMT